MSAALRLYEVPSGFHVPASSLTPEEALYVHRRGWLNASDFELLQPAAMVAIALAIEERVRGESNRAVQFWGVVKPRRVMTGRA